MLALPAIISSIRGWFRLRAERRSMRISLEELDRLPDRLLDDIGISHDDIACAFRKGRLRASSLDSGKSQKPWPTDDPGEGSSRVTSLALKRAPCAGAFNHTDVKDTPKRRTAIRA
jgi:uncharacterized protein YjiS (DUF1127 family)